MSVDMKEKAQEAMKKMFFCGAVFAATSIGSVASMAELIKDVKQNAPEQIIGGDGHDGYKLSPSQAAKFGGMVVSSTLAMGAAFFGYRLKKEHEKEQKAINAALMAAKQQSK